MDQLQDELVAKIFRLVHKEDQMKIFKVCKRWYKIMDTLVGIRVRIGRGIQSAQEEFDSANTLSKFGVRSCELDSYLNDSAMLPKLKYPDMLEFVSFKNFISSASFQSILKQVTMLHTFSIDHIAIYHLEFSDIPFSLPCQVLRIISGDSFTAYQIKEHRILSINTLHLLRQSFPGLKYLNVSLVILSKMYKGITEEIRSFLCRHSKELTRIFMSLRRAEKWNPAVCPVQSIPPALPIQHCTFEKLSRIYITQGNYFPTETSDWLTWTEQTTNLEIVNTTFNVFAMILPKNLESLRQISFVSIYDYLFDCTVLQSCLMLNSLTIFSHLRSRTSKAENQVVHANLLPKSLSLTHLTIHGLLVSCDSCRSIFSQLPALNRLYLTKIANSDSFGYGVPPDVTKKILDQKKIKYFKIDVGTDAVEESSDAQFNSIYKINREICGILNDNGEYIIHTSEKGQM